jgi:TRAP-type mannitol/chloroaromatic compound transport system permease small subunit
LLKRVEKILGFFIDVVGFLTSILMILLILNVAYDVVMRYALHKSSIAMQEMEWHIFSVMMLFGMGVALKDEAHVRVDFLYDRFSPKTKAIINIFGTLLFLIPLALLIIYGSYDFVLDAYDTNEISDDPGGLSHRWIIKSMIPFSFIFLILSAIYYLIRQIRIIKGEEIFEDSGMEDMV